METQPPDAKAVLQANLQAWMTYAADRKMSTGTFLGLENASGVSRMPALFLTIPLHLIYALVGGRRPSGPPPPNPSTHVRCPDCAELVQAEARKCKHCGAGLVPASERLTHATKQR